eukprot:scaffold42898_cov62-Phaeocystis_antarctica.AAC.4
MPGGRAAQSRQTRVWDALGICPSRSASRCQHQPARGPRHARSSERRRRVRGVAHLLRAEPPASAVVGEGSLARGNSNTAAAVPVHVRFRSDSVPSPCAD